MSIFDVKKILVPLDGSPTSFRGLEKAIYFARQCHAEITGLCIAYVPSQLAFESVIDVDSATRKKIDRFLDKAKTACAENGIVFHGKVDHGHPRQKILEYAAEWNVDLMVIGSRGAGSTDESFIGSVANHIIQKTKIPTIIVK